MLDDSGKLDGFRPDRNRSRRRRVQRRVPPVRDFFDISRNEVSYHSVRRMERYRMRRTMWFVKLSAALLFGLILPFAIKWGYDRFLCESDYLRLRHVIIDTSGTLDEAAIMAESGVEVGNSLLRLDPDVIQSRIAALRMVESVEVSRRFPDSVLIKVMERIPQAWLYCPDLGILPHQSGGYLIDDNGACFVCSDECELWSLLPIIEVSGMVHPESRVAGDSDRLLRAIKLIKANNILFAKRGMSIIRVIALSDWGLLCQYPGDFGVTFDCNRIEGGLQDLDEILEKAASANLSLASVNLVTVKNIPVTFHPGGDITKW